jgi:anaerobic magnesium-protoporphyrin IX monomethyl ester cyclase
MRIAFEGTTLQPERTGVGYYTEHLLRHLERISPSDDFVILSNRKPVPSQALPPRVEVTYPARAMVRLAWMQAAAPLALRRSRADVAHFTNGIVPLATRVPTVVTIHDMSLTLYPECHPTRRRLLKGPLQRLAATHAAAIITPSTVAKRDLVRLYGVDPDRVHVVYEAAAPEFTRVSDPARLAEVRRRHALPDRFVLYVGAIEPRKNLKRLLDAFAARHHAGDLPYQLVCVGPYGWLSRDLGRHIDALGIGAAVHFTGYVPFDDLPAIYSLADMFIFPSLYEGFGLPVIEALACGAPVIIGQAESLVEIGGDAVTVVDPLDTAAIGDALVALGRDADRRRDLSFRGLRQAAQFSWDRAARETLGVYRAAIAAAAPTVAGRRASAALQPIVASEPRASATDVLVGHAYYLRFDAKLWDAQQPYPPLGTLYAAAYLREQGHRVAVFDAMLAESESEWTAALDRERPRVAVIFEDNFNYLSKMCLLRMREASLTMIAAARARGVPVIVSGSDATDHPEIYLDHGAACVVAGEGEVTVTHAIDGLAGRSGVPLAAVPGLCLRDERGGLIRTGVRPFIKSLDALPRPAWDLVDMGRYQQVWREHHRTFSMNLATTRGCPYSCNWCAKPIYGQRYATRSPANVVAEMAWLKRAYAPEHLWIVDDIFGLTPGWIEAFAAQAAREDAAIPFKCLMRADQVTPPVVAALTAARCRTVWLGAESGSQRILDAMDKGITVADIVTASALLRRAGIDVGLFLQFGYPGETRTEIALTERMVRQCRPDDIGISISYPLPGTPFHERVRAELGVKQNWFDSNDLAALYHATYSPEFYRVLHSAVHARFRLHKVRALARAILRPWTLRTRHVRQAVSILTNLVRLPFLRWELMVLSRSGDDTRPGPMPGLRRPGATVAGHQDA